MSYCQDMQRVVIDPPITHENYRDLLAEILNNEKLNYIGEPLLSEFLSPLSRTEFCNSGVTYTVKPVLTSPTAKQNYLYVQNLSILSMDRRYYTHRYCGDSFLLLYTLSGEGRFEANGKTYLLRPGDGVWINCATEHFYCTVGEEWTHVALHFLGAGANAYYEEYLSGSPVNFHQETNGVFHRLIESLIRDYGSLSFGREVRISNGISNILTHLITDSNQSHPAQDSLFAGLQQVIIYLEEHLAEAITLDQLSEHAHISKYHLVHEFQRLTGFSPIEYLINLRMNQACFLLQSTKMPIARVGEAVGIPNNQYFGKLFKKKTGSTPGEYRKAAK